MKPLVLFAFFLAATGQAMADGRPVHSKPVHKKIVHRQTARPLAIPPNDELCGAIDLTPTSACTFQTFSNVDGSGSANLPAPNCESFTGIDADVWFKFTVPAGATSITMDAIGGSATNTMNDGGAAIYSFTGAACASYTLTQLACNGSSSTSSGADMPKITVAVTPGQTYYIRFWGFGGEQGTFGICVTANIPPSNDNCATPTPLTVNPDYLCGVTTAGSTANSTQSPNTPNPSCGTVNGWNDDVWFSFVATTSAHRIVLSNIQPAATSMTMQVYSGTCGSLTLVTGGCINGATLNLTGLIPSQTYLVRVYTNVTTATTSAGFNICVGTAPPPPPNDDCVNAIPLTVNPNYLCGVTTNSTTESATQSASTPNPSCGTVNGWNDDVWFSFTATTSAHRIVLSNILPAATSMTMQVYSGTCGALTLFTGGCINGNTLNLTGLTPTQTYLVRVYTNVTTVGTTASFTICVGTAPPPPSNDECITAVNLAVNPDLNCGNTTNGTTESATPSTGAPAPDCGTVTGVNDDVWYKFTATGPVHWITLTNVTPVNTMSYQVFSGSCGTLSQVTCVTANNVAVISGLTPTQVYYVRLYTNVATVGTSSAFTICIGTPPPPPVNNECTGALPLQVNSTMTCTLTSSGTTAGATQSSGATTPTCGTATGINDDVWFSFMATSTTHAISFPSVSPVGTVMNIVGYSGTCGNLALIGCATNATLGLNNLIVGNTYYIRVYTNVATPTVFANFNICVGTPPPLPTCQGNLPAGDACGNATPVCNFDGYCGNTSASYAVDTWPELTAAFCGSIENNSFVTFIASATSASFNVWVTSSTMNSGIQMMFYSGGCGSGAVTSYGCAAYNPIPPTPVGGSPTVVTANGLTPGNTYYLMFDGFAGDVCDYVITPINGVSVLNVTPTSASICAGASVTLTASGGNGTYSWSPATGLNTTTGTTVIATPAVTTTYTVTSASSAGCPITKTVTITVNSNASLTLTSAAPTTNQTICINTPLTNIIYAVGGGATNATVTGLPAGITGNYASGVFTISGIPNVSGTFNYTVTTSAGCGGSTVSLSGTITITVAGTLTLNSANNIQSVCINSPISNIIYTASAGATAATATGLPPGVTGTFTGSTYTLAGTPTAAGIYNYSVSTAGCGAAQTGTITVTNATVVLTSPAATANQTVCVNTAITNIVYTSGNGAANVTVSPLPAGVTGTYSGGTNGTFTITGTPTATGSFPYTITASGCGTATINGTITVSTASTITLTSAPATTTQTPCINTLITPITYTIGGGGTGATVTGPLPAGVTGTFAGGVFTISGTPTAAGTFNYTVNATGGCGTASATGTITVRPLTTITLTSGSANQTVCINTAITNIVYTSANGATNVTVSTLPAGLTGTYSGGTNGTFTIAGTPTVSGVFPYTVSTAGGCGIATLSGTITINAASSLTLTSAAGTNAQTICINTAVVPITYSVGGVATGATVANLPAGVTGTFSGGVVTISGTPTVSGTFNYIVTTSGGCGVATANGTITVSPAVTMVLTSAAATANQTLCINTAITGIVYTTGNGATGATAVGLPAGVTGTYSGGTNGTFTISGTPTVSGPFNYVVSTSGGCGNASLNGVINVNALSTISLTSAAGTNAQTVCINTPITNIIYSTANGVTGATITGLPAGVAGVYSGGTNGTVSISGTPNVTGTFTYNINTSGGCGVANATGTITVRSLSTISLTSAAATAAQTICQNGSITNIVYAIGGSATGATVAGLPSGVNGVFNAGVFTISGTAASSGVFNYTVTPTSGCGNASASGTINVSPALTANAGPSVSIAAGTTTQLNGQGTAGANYLWTANGPLALTSATILNPIANPMQTTTYTLTVSDANTPALCPSASSSMVVTVVTSCINVRNAFTPNGDGMNDTWYVYDQNFCLKPNVGVTVNVYNRYGNKVYSSENYTNSWDGTYKSKPVPDGTYFAVVEFTLQNGFKQVVKTDVTVLR